MSKIEQSTERLGELRSGLHLSQQDFASRIGISQGALSQLESGKSALSIQTIINICSTFGVDCNWLVLGQGELTLESANVEEFEVPVIDNSPDKPDTNLIPLVREEAHAGYIKGYKDLEYIHTLDVYSIPGFEKGDYRLFEVEGDSMVPTIYPREIVVTESVKNIDDIENGSLCVLITEEGIVAKRAYVYEENTSAFILKSDNASYQTYTVDKDKVVEIWLIRAKITSNLAIDSSEEQSRLDSIEADIKALKKKIGDHP